MCLVGALPWFRGALLFVAQLLGGICASAVVLCLFPGPLLATTGLTGGTSLAQGVFIEMFLTAELVFTIFMLAAEKHRGTYLAPIGIGLSLFLAELTGVFFTGGSLNPARSFGPAVANRQFDTDHWIYWVGPGLGAVVAAGFYKFIKMLEYETANPGQDEEDERHVADPDMSPEEVKYPREHDVADRKASSSRQDPSSRRESAGGSQTLSGPDHTRTSPDHSSRDPRQDLERGQLYRDDGTEASHGREAPTTQTAPSPPDSSSQSRSLSSSQAKVPFGRAPGRYEYDERGQPVKSGYLPEGVPRSGSSHGVGTNQERQAVFPPAIGRV